jgi:hypothetical protein
MDNIFIDLLPIMIKESFENLTNPISNTNVNTPGQIKAHFNPISYEKVDMNIILKRNFFFF